MLSTSLRVSQMPCTRRLRFLIGRAASLLRQRPKFAEFPFRDCPKSLGSAHCVALQATEKCLFGPFLSGYTGQNYARSSAYTPFRTVSPRTPVNRVKNEGPDAVRFTSNICVVRT